MEKIIQKLNHLEQLINDLATSSRETMTFKEAAKFLDLKEGYLYRLVHAKSIPYYKPNGGKLYFKRSELESWMLSNRHQTRDEIEAGATTYVTSNPKRA